MPRGDGTGPQGQEKRAGRGKGYCSRQETTPQGQSPKNGQGDNRQQGKGGCRRQGNR